MISSQIAGVLKMFKTKILATNSKSNCSFWKENVTIYTEYLNELGVIWRTNKAESILFNLKWGYRFFVKSRDYDAIVTNADKASLIFAVMQLMLRRTRKPHILLFVLWNQSDNKVKGFFKQILYKIILKSVTKVIVYSKKQQSLHSKAFGVPTEKFPIVPYHTTIRNVDVEISEGDYLFAGGDTGRDYRTLIEAMRGLPFKLTIAALYRNHFKGIDIPENVKIVTVNGDEFMHLIAGCRAMALPLFKDVLQAGGQQTFLNAMAMGKTVIVADDNSAAEYIESGVDGLIIPPEDVNAMRAEIINVMNNAALCKTIGRNAELKANTYTVARFTKEVYRLIIKECSCINNKEI